MGWFVAFAAVGGAGLVRGVAFQQEELDRHLRHDPAQALCALVGHRAADAQVETQIPQLSRLLLAAGKAVHHAAQAAAAAQGQRDFLQCTAGMHGHRQVAFARQLQLTQEIVPLQFAIEAVHVEIQADLADRCRRVHVQP